MVNRLTSFTPLRVPLSAYAIKPSYLDANRSDFKAGMDSDSVSTAAVLTLADSMIDSTSRYLYWCTALSDAFVPDATVNDKMAGPDHPCNAFPDFLFLPNRYF